MFHNGFSNLLQASASPEENARVPGKFGKDSSLQVILGMQ